MKFLILALFVFAVNAASVGNNFNSRSFSRASAVPVPPAIYTAEEANVASAANEDEIDPGLSSDSTELLKADSGDSVKNFNEVEAGQTLKSVVDDAVAPAAPIYGRRLPLAATARRGTAPVSVAAPIANEAGVLSEAFTASVISTTPSRTAVAQNYGRKLNAPAVRKIPVLASVIEPVSNISDAESAPVVPTAAPSPTISSRRLTAQVSRAATVPVSVTEPSIKLPDTDSNLSEVSAPILPAGAAPAAPSPAATESIAPISRNRFATPAARGVSLPTNNARRASNVPNSARFPSEASAGTVSPTISSATVTANYGRRASIPARGAESDINVPNTAKTLSETLAQLVPGAAPTPAAPGAPKASVPDSATKSVTNALYAGNPPLDASAFPISPTTASTATVAENSSRRYIRPAGSRASVPVSVAEPVSAVPNAAGLSSEVSTGTVPTGVSSATMAPNYGRRFGAQAARKASQPASGAEPIINAPITAKTLPETSAPIIPATSPSPAAPSAFKPSVLASVAKPISNALYTGNPPIDASAVPESSTTPSTATIADNSSRRYIGPAGSRASVPGSVAKPVSAVPNAAGLSSEVSTGTVPTGVSSATTAPNYGRRFGAQAARKASLPESGAEPIINAPITAKTLPETSAPLIPATSPSPAAPSAFKPSVLASVAKPISNALYTGNPPIDASAVPESPTTPSTATIAENSSRRYIGPASSRASIPASGAEPVSALPNAASLSSEVSSGTVPAGVSSATMAPNYGRRFSAQAARKASLPASGAEPIINAPITAKTLPETSAPIIPATSLSPAAPSAFKPSVLASVAKPISNALYTGNPPIDASAVPESPTTPSTATIADNSSRRYIGPAGSRASVPASVAKPVSAVPNAAGLSSEVSTGTVPTGVSSATTAPNYGRRFGAQAARKASLPESGAEPIINAPITAKTLPETSAPLIPATSPSPAAPSAFKPSVLASVAKPISNALYTGNPPIDASAVPESPTTPSTATIAENSSRRYIGPASSRASIPASGAEPVSALPNAASLSSEVSSGTVPAGVSSATMAPNYGRRFGAQAARKASLPASGVEPIINAAVTAKTLPETSTPRIPATAQSPAAPGAFKPSVTASVAKPISNILYTGNPPIDASAVPESSTTPSTATIADNSSRRYIGPAGSRASVPGSVSKPVSAVPNEASLSSEVSAGTVSPAKSSATVVSNIAGLAARRASIPASGAEPVVNLQNVTNPPSEPFAPNVPDKPRSFPAARAIAPVSDQRFAVPTSRKVPISTKVVAAPTVSKVSNPSAVSYASAGIVTSNSNYDVASKDADNYPSLNVAGVPAPSVKQNIANTAAIAKVAAVSATKVKPEVAQIAEPDENAIPINGDERLNPELSSRGAKTINDAILYSSFNNVDDGYTYGFETSNGINAESSGTLKKVNDAMVIVSKGSFEYMSPDGTPVQFSYVADERGYQPMSDILPVGPPIPKAILLALEYISTHPKWVDDSKAE